jgi:hypothetical protein
VTARAAGTRLIGVAVCAAAAAVAGCGHKGPPQPPLRPIPVAVADLSVEREGAAIRVRVPIPDANMDGSRPPAVDRVEIYAMTLAADAPPPGNVALIVPDNLVGTIAIRPPEREKAGKAEPPKPDTPPDPRPAAGDVTTFVDPNAPTGAGSLRYYAAVAAAGRRRSHTSGILTVPLGDAPAVPANVRVTYTEQKLTLSWETAAPGGHFFVAQTDDAGASAKRLTSAPQETTTYEQAVEFGKPQCFVVRAVDVHGAVTILGAPSAPTCVTPVDHFPPPVPTDLQAVASDGGVNLVWNAVQAADLAGYIILRGDGPNGTLQRLPSSPVVTSTSFRDTTARSGATYVYAVAAIDKATPPNVSEPSERKSVTARVSSGSDPGGRFLAPLKLKTMTLKVIPKGEAK